MIPSIAGRERFLEQCLASYAAHTTDYETFVVMDRETCGIAWLEGAEKATGDYIHFSADDLQPLQGWLGAAQSVTRLGLLPAPRILNGDGTLQSCGGSDGVNANQAVEMPTGHRTDFTRIPFMTREQWDLIRPHVEGFLLQSHYFTDNAISWGAAQEGIGTAVHRGYGFLHHLAQEGRGAGMSEPNRMQHDYDLFMEMTQKEAA